MMCNEIKSNGIEHQPQIRIKVYNVHVMINGMKRIPDCIRGGGNATR